MMDEYVTSSSAKSTFSIDSILSQKLTNTTKTLAEYSERNCSSIVEVASNNDDMYITKRKDTFKNIYTSDGYTNETMNTIYTESNNKEKDPSYNIAVSETKKDIKENFSSYTESKGNPFYIKTVEHHDPMSDVQPPASSRDSIDGISPPLPKMSSCSCFKCVLNENKLVHFYTDDLSSVNYPSHCKERFVVSNDVKDYQFSLQLPKEYNSRTSSFASMKESNNHAFNKRRRTIFTTRQLERLECEFKHQQYIVGQERRFLASQLGLNEIQVKVWFQNRRIKHRKQFVREI